jgi:hypothetical protein
MEEQTEVQNNLSINDIMLLKQIVEVASSRGAFRADELSTVGEVYNKVTAWLQSVTPEESEEETEEESQEESTQGEADA